MKNFLKITGIAFLIGLIGCQNESGNPPEKPNIIYILADDLGYGDLGSYGQTEIMTPNLDRMRSEGMKFTQHYAGSTVCAPSRSVLMTGLHTGHTPIRGNREHMPIGQHPLPDSSITVAEVLKNAGYSTGAFGKWGLGFPGSEGSPSNQGFDYFFGYNGQRRAHFYYPEFLFREQANAEIEKVQLKGNKVNDNPERHPGSGPPVQRGQFSPDVITREALSFIDRNKGQPFFLYMPITIPHASIIAPDETLKSYLDADGESIFEEEPHDGNHYTSQPRPKATYAAMVTQLDNYVGQIMDKLENEGLAENTLIIFTSDNGPHEEGGYDPAYFNSNGPLRGIKRDLYEGGIRVPMLAWWPETIEENSISDHISSFSDMMPTFAELAGVNHPQKTDGISMVPTLLSNGSQKQHDYLYWEFPARGGKQAVRMDNWKAVRLGVSQNADALIELYDLSNDIGEEKNVAEMNPHIVQKMGTIMEQAHDPSELFPLFEK